ncbi:MAG TPA: alpha/beta hydrolase, partial [Desulfomonilia bacterium]|nr:alpha/beta hydrolase [Desulfomonilia bacterium]
GPIERDLHRLNHPVLLIWGDRDKYLDVGLTQHFKTRIKDIRIEIIGDCGHSPHEENPDLVNRLMTEFLGEQQYSNLLPQS